MKKSILALTIISSLGYGILHFCSESILPSENIENKIADSSKVSRFKPGPKELPGLSVDETALTAPSLDDLESHFEIMETQDLQKEQLKIENSKARESLIVRANSGKLSFQDEIEHKSYLRSQAVISKILMDRKFEDMEEL
jgi:hypothetical protein